MGDFLQVLSWVWVRWGGEGQNRTVDTTIFSRVILKVLSFGDYSRRVFPNKSALLRLLFGHEWTGVLIATTQQLRSNYAAPQNLYFEHAGSNRFDVARSRRE